MDNKKEKTKYILWGVILAIIGICYILGTWHRYKIITEENALELAMTAGASFQRKGLSELEASVKDLGKQEYHEIKNSLHQLMKIHKEIRNAFLYTIKNDLIYLMVDSEPVNSEYYAPPGQVYFETHDYFDQVFRNSKPVVTGPITDNRGIWIGALVPLNDYITGKTIAVFCMSYPVEQWNRNILIETVQAGITVVSLLALFVLVHSIIIKNRTLKNDKSKLLHINDKLKEKEELFRLLFEQLPLGVAFGNVKNSVIDANHIFQKIVGRSKEELLDLNWMDVTHPDDIQNDLYHFTKFMAGEIDGYTIRKRYIRPDHSIVWVNMTIAPLQIQDKSYLSHICIVEDITDKIITENNLQESERSMAMLLSNLPGMAYRCNYDRKWTIQFVSGGCYELTGYQPESLLRNKDLSFNDLINKEYQEYIWEKWIEVINTRGMFKEEYTITTAAGETKWVYEQGQGVFNEKGEVEALEGLIIDISLQKKREEEILYLTFHDVLTGLYNRRYFEETKKRIDHPDNYPLSVIVADINGLKLINSALGHLEGDKMLLSAADILRGCSRSGDLLIRSGGDEFTILLPNTTYEETYTIINQISKMCDEYKKKAEDEAYHLSISMGCATKTSDNDTLAVKLKEAEESMFRHKLLQKKSLHSAIISSLKSSLNEKDLETEQHAQRLIKLSRAIGEKLNLVEEQLNQLELLSTLHDVGKIGITDNILNKPGKLTEEEWVEMRRHPEMGYRIAIATPELAPIADYILNHHERWDGKGYPYGKKGEEIPLLSRIIAVADAYDAMTSDRPYRKAMPKEAAVEEIRINAGTQFDPLISELFIEYINKEN